MVILIAVYTVVLVLLKDQWWYIWAWCVQWTRKRLMCGQPSVHPSELKCHWRSAGLESKPTKRSFLFSLSVQKHPQKRVATALCCWYSFHSTESYPSLCNLGELKWGLGKCIRWFTPISCIWTDLSIDKSWSLLNSCASSCAHISYICVGKVWI